MSKTTKSRVFSRRQVELGCSSWKFHYVSGGIRRSKKEKKKKKKKEKNEEKKGSRCTEGRNRTCIFVLATRKSIFFEGVDSSRLFAVDVLV